jgi:hypothetical protein
MATTPSLDRLLQLVFDLEQNFVDTFGKLHGLLPERVRSAKLPLADRLIDPVTLVNKSYAAAEKVLGDTETGKIVTRQKELAASLAAYLSPHFGAA